MTRRRWRLAVYLLVAGAGALVLDPVLKSLVGRLRPVVAHPVAHGNGDSFPSGHSLSSIVCYGAILLVFLPATHGRWRRAFVAGIITLVALIGISRILLGVHYVSDVLGGWALGIAWLVVVAAEMIAVNSGLGYLIIDARNAGKRYDLVVAGMLMIGLIGLILDLLIRRLERFEEVKWGYFGGR